MERKGLPGTEAYPCGLWSVPGNPLQPMRWCGFKAKISRFQENKKNPDYFTKVTRFGTLVWYDGRENEKRT